jgi:hypothetical protein
LKTARRRERAERWRGPRSAPPAAEVVLAAAVVAVGSRSSARGLEPGSRRRVVKASWDRWVSGVERAT